jgi:SAM-dependent methyltransferase
MTHPADVKQQQRTQWNAAAAGWERWFDWYSANFRPMFDWCCDAAAIDDGARVLDVAGGSGQPAITIAERVGTSGSVVSTDLSDAMLDVARRHATSRGLDRIEFQTMDAERLEFETASFDAVTCSSALMFVPDALGAVREMRRVLRRGGRAAIMVWDEPQHNSFFTMAGGSVAKFFPPAPPAADAPGAFRFARPGVLASLMTDAGFADIHEESRPMTVTCASPDEYWQMFIDNAAGVKDKIGVLSSEQLARLISLVREAAAPFVCDGRLELTVTPRCVSAQNPLS